ncbi:MAG TPA: alpha/beta hydrolase [Vicinamibacterales bacterium]|nr:alpha/beta hydrolase [Vicinamibacterales bacterium]
MPKPLEDLAWRQSKPTGDAILWLHGYTLDSSIWEELWSELPEFRHIGLDLPGHGQSRSMTPDEDLRSLSRTISSFAGELTVKYLAGISFGGMIALQVAADAPAQFSALILGSPPLAGGPVDPHAQTCNLTLMRLFREKGRGPWLRERWMTCPPDIFRGAINHPALRERLARVIDAHRWEELADSRMARFTIAAQTPDVLRRVQVPTLLLIGEDDMASFKRTSTLIGRHVPHCQRMMVPGAGHLALLEKPAAMAPLVRTHLERFK